jgi:leader peptidase (prepilin peptidase)/N-methyltransferase
MIVRHPYFVIALIGGGVLAISLLLFEPKYASVSCLLGWTMLAIAASDAERFVVPDVLSLPAIPAGLIATRFLADAGSANAELLEHSLAAIVGATALLAVKQLYLLWRSREGLGLGDVKLAAVAGAWTGLQGLSYVLLAACLLAFAYVLIVNRRNLNAIEATSAVPFGVFLGPSIWLVWCISALTSEMAVWPSPF